MDEAHGCGVEEALPTRGEIDAVMVATRVMVAVSAQSVASVEDRVSLPQFRVLVMIASRGPQNVTSVGEGLGVHTSNATRLCDKLFEAGFIHRDEDPTDRRSLVLQLTESGYQLVKAVTDQRRASIAKVLAKMPAALRNDLLPALRAFADAAGEIPEGHVWALGWTTEQPVDLHG